MDRETGVGRALRGRDRVVRLVLALSAAGGVACGSEGEATTRGGGDRVLGVARVAASDVDTSRTLYLTLLESDSQGGTRASSVHILERFTASLGWSAEVKLAHNGLHSSITGEVARSVGRVDIMPGNVRSSGRYHDGQPVSTIRPPAWPQAEGADRETASARFGSEWIHGRRQPLHAATVAASNTSMLKGLISHDNDRQARDAARLRAGFVPLSDRGVFRRSLPGAVMEIFVDLATGLDTAVHLRPNDPDLPQISERHRYRRLDQDSWIRSESSIATSSVRGRMTSRLVTIRFDSVSTREGL